MPRVPVAPVLVLALSLTTAGMSVNAQTPARTVSVRDGLYTSEQAARGMAVYNRHCAECHARDLGGHEYAGPLAGFGFQLKWQDASVAELFGRVRSMPLGRPGLLSGQEYLDIVAYLLQQNTYPAGARELTAAVAGQRWPRILLERVIKDPQ
jgi:mono/diheme cytochrome c family protein